MKAEEPHPEHSRFETLVVVLSFDLLLCLIAGSIITKLSLIPYKARGQSKVPHIFTTRMVIYTPINLLSLINVQVCFIDCLGLGGKQT